MPTTSKKSTRKKNEKTVEQAYVERHPSLAAPATGSDNPVVSGVVPNRSHETSPDDPEQQRRLQARQESEWAAGLRDDHPEFVRAHKL